MANVVNVGDLAPEDLGLVHPTDIPEEEEKNEMDERAGEFPDRKNYSKPRIELIKDMQFPFSAIKQTTEIACRQCSSCHSCR